MDLAEVLSIAHWSMVKRQNVSGRTPFAYKVDLTDGAHPGLYGPVYLLLVRNVALWIHKGLGANGQYSISRNKPPTL